MAKLLIHSSHGKEDPERATLPFILGNNAVLAGQEAVILLTIDAVWLATEGGADGIQKEGLPPLAQIMGEFIEGGGQVWACQACTKPRGITEDRLVKGSRIAAAMEAVEFLSQGAQSLTF
jgi:predicted peroxiredoxin